MKLLKKLKGRFKTKLPTHVEELDQYVKDLFEIYELPDDPSYRQAVYSLIMHVPPTEDKASMSHFAKAIRKAMANQVAYLKIEELRKQAKAEATAKEQQEVTPQTESPSGQSVQDQKV